MTPLVRETMPLFSKPLTPSALAAHCRAPGRGERIRCLQTQVDAGTQFEQAFLRREPQRKRSGFLSDRLQLTDGNR
jgi:hypothetical protein